MAYVTGVVTGAEIGVLTHHLSKDHTRRCHLPRRLPLLTSRTRPDSCWICSQTCQIPGIRGESVIR